MVIRLTQDSEERLEALSAKSFGTDHLIIIAMFHSSPSQEELSFCLLAGRTTPP
jgi:hypothetical protein